MEYMGDAKLQAVYGSNLNHYWGIVNLLGYMSASLHSHLTCKETASHIHWIRGWVNPKASLEQKNPFLLLGLAFSFLVRPAHSLVTVWIQVLELKRLNSCANYKLSNIKHYDFTSHPIFNPHASNITLKGQADKLIAQLYEQLTPQSWPLVTINEYIRCSHPQLQNILQQKAASMPHVCEP